MLPSDICIYRIRAVKDDAHARFSATYRTYHYYVHHQKNPFLRSYSYRVPGKELDYALMNQAAAILYEYKDFTSFSKLHTDVKTNDCQIMKAEWINLKGDQWVFEIQANRFLRNMVRAIVGTLVEVGRGKLTLEGFRRIIEQKDRCSAGMSMPGNALFLVGIGYPHDIYK
jgi:tRNA pseudouridine38-40 synthase